MTGKTAKSGKRPSPSKKRPEGVPGTARNKIRRVAVVTGTRAEYGLLRSTMEAISRHASMKLQLVATGTHLLKRFGDTIKDIVRDGWRVDARVRMQTGDDSPLDQAEGLARGVAGMARYFQKAETDIVVVLGDRIEAMAGALAGVTTGRLVAHIHGGDVAPGDFDDRLRHAITKLAHLHLTATQAARRRVIRMGEAPDRVHVVGAPGLDRLIQLRESRFNVPNANELNRPRTVAVLSPDACGAAPAGLNGKTALIVQHPCGRSAQNERRVMEAILRVVEQMGLCATCLYPNSDRGHSGIIEAIEAHRRRVREDRFRVVQSVDHDRYLQWLIDADVLVGNSSSGIIEAATAGTPSVDVGPRQCGREVSGESVLHARETDFSIRRAVARALRLRPITSRRSVYGNGFAGQRIAALLGIVPLDPPFHQKKHPG